MRRGANAVFRDVTLVILVVMIALVILLLPHLNPPGKKQTADTNLPGNVSVEIRWPDGWRTDVDLWVQAPKDVPVGYSNKSGEVFDLLRDDLGGLGDLGNLNYENSYSRGIPAGEYIINLHLYTNREGTTPVPVDVTVSTKTPGRGFTRILKTSVFLKSVGQEITVFRFHLNEDGLILSGTLHSNFTSIRSADQQRGGGYQGP